MKHRCRRCTRIAELNESRLCPDCVTYDKTGGEPPYWWDISAAKDPDKALLTWCMALAEQLGLALEQANVRWVYNSSTDAHLAVSEVVSGILLTLQYKMNDVERQSI